MNKTSQTIPEILHVSDEDEAVLCPSESHIESLSVLQEADASSGPHTGDDDDVPLTALVSVHRVDHHAAQLPLHQLLGDVLLLLGVVSDDPNVELSVEFSDGVHRGKSDLLLGLVKTAAACLSHCLPSRPASLPTTYGL